MTRCHLLCLPDCPVRMCDSFVCACALQHVVTSGEDAKVRTRVVQSPNGGEPVEFEERLLEEPDAREKPFVHAYSWSTHKHPFGDKMDNVVVSAFFSFWS